MNTCDVCGKESCELLPHEYQVIDNPDEIGEDFSKLRLATILGQMCPECIREYETHPIKLDKTIRNPPVKELRKMYEESKDIHNHK